MKNEMDKTKKNKEKKYVIRKILPAPLYNRKTVFNRIYKYKEL